MLRPPAGTRSWASEVAAIWTGTPLFPWQTDVVRRAMVWDPLERRLTQTEVGLVCPRRNGKTQLLIARILGGCLGSGRHRGEDVLYTAHQGDTVRATFKTVRDFLERSELLAPLVADVKLGKGDEEIQFTNGSRFWIRARTNSGGRGLECDTLILDEALELNADHVAALTPLVAKAQARGGGQIWWASSAGHGRSDILAGLRDRGRAGTDPGLTWEEHYADRADDPASPVTWRKANRSLGTHILNEAFLSMQYRSMSATPTGLESFGREHLGWWTTEVATPFLPAGTWQATMRAERPTPPPRARVVLGLEWQNYGRAVLVAAVELGDGNVWVEPVHRWWDPLGLDPEQLAADIAPIVRKIRPLLVAADDFTCTPILDHLEARGIPTRRMNLPRMRAAGDVLVAAVTGGRLTSSTDQTMCEELEAVGSAPTGDGGTRMSRKKASGPSTAAYATACAVAVALSPPATRPKIHVGT